MIYYICFMYFLSTAFVESVYGRRFFCYPVGWTCPQHHLLNIAVCCEPAQCVLIDAVKQTYSITKRNISYTYYRCKIPNDNTGTAQAITERNTANTETMETIKHESMADYDTLGIENKSISQKIQADNINYWLRKLEKRVQEQQHSTTRKYVKNEVENYMESAVDSTNKLVNSLVGYQQHSKAFLKNNYFSQENSISEYNSLKSRIQKRSINHDEHNSDMKDGILKEKNNIVLKILDNVKNHTNSEHNSESFHKNSIFHNSTASDVNSVQIMRKRKKSGKEHTHKVDVSNENQIATDNTEWAIRKRHASARKNNMKSRLKLNLTLTNEVGHQFNKKSYKSIHVNQFENDTTELKHVNHRNNLHTGRNINGTLNRKGTHIPDNKKYATFNNHKDIYNKSMTPHAQKENILKTIINESATSILLTQNEEETSSEATTHIAGDKHISANVMPEVLTGKKQYFAGSKLNDNDIVETVTLNMITSTPLSKHEKSLINENSLDNVNTDAIQTQMTNEYTSVPIMSSELHNVNTIPKPEIHSTRLGGLLSKLLRTKSSTEHSTPISNYISKSPHINIQNKMQSNTITESILYGALREKPHSSSDNNIMNIESKGTQKLRENTSFTIKSTDSVSEFTSNGKTYQKSEIKNKATTVNSYVSNEVTASENVNHNNEAITLENMQNDIIVSDSAQNEVTTIDNVKGDELRTGEITTKNFQTKATASMNIMQTEIIADDAINVEATTIKSITYNEETTFEDILQSEVTTFENVIYNEVVAGAENVQTEINSEKLKSENMSENVQSTLTTADIKTQKEMLNESSISKTATDEIILQTEEVMSVENMIETDESTVDSATPQNEAITFEKTIPNKVTMPENTIIYTIVTTTESAGNAITFTENNLQNTENEVEEDENIMKNEEASSDTTVQNEISTDEHEKNEVISTTENEVPTISENFMQNDITVENVFSSESRHVEGIDKSFVNMSKTENAVIDIQQIGNAVQTVQYNLSDNDTQTPDIQNEDISNDGNLNKFDEIIQNKVNSVDEQNNTNNVGTVNIMDNNAITTFPGMKDSINSTDILSEIQNIQMQDSHLKTDDEINEIDTSLKIIKDESKILNMTNFNLMQANGTEDAISITGGIVTDETNFEKDLVNQDLNQHEFVTHQYFTESNVNEEITESVLIDEETMNNEIMPIAISVDSINNGSEPPTFVINSNEKSHSHEHLYDNRNISEELLTDNGIYHIENETVPEVLPNPESFHGNISDLGDSYYQDENSSYVGSNLDGRNEYYHQENGSITGDRHEGFNDNNPVYSSYGYDGSTSNNSNNSQENSHIHEGYNNSENGSKVNEHFSDNDFHNGHYNSENESNSTHDVFTDTGHTDHYQTKDENNVWENDFGYHDSENVSNIQDNQYSGYAQNISDNNQESHGNDEHSSYNQHENTTHILQEFAHEHGVYNDNYLNENGSDIYHLNDRNNAHDKMLNNSYLHEELHDYNVHTENESNVDNGVYKHEELHDSQIDVRDNLNIQSEDNHSENGSVIHVDEHDSRGELHETHGHYQSEDVYDVQKRSHEITNTTLEDSFGTSNIKINVNSSDKNDSAFVDYLGGNNNDIIQLDRSHNDEALHDHGGMYRNSDRNIQDNQYSGYVQNISDNNQESYGNDEHSSYNHHENTTHILQEFVHEHGVNNDNYLNENGSDIYQLNDRNNAHDKILNNSYLHEELHDYNVHTENESNVDTGVYKHEELYDSQIGKENFTDGIYESANDHENLPNYDSQRLHNNDSNAYEELNGHVVYHHEQDFLDNTLHSSAFGHGEILHGGGDDSYSDMQHNGTYDAYNEHNLNSYVHDNNSYVHENLHDQGDYGGYTHDEHYPNHYVNSSDHYEHLNNYENENNVNEGLYEHDGNFTDHEDHYNNSATGMSYDHNENMYHDNVDYHERGGNVNYDDNERLYHNETGYGDNENHHNETNYENVDHMTNADYNIDNAENIDNMDNTDIEGNANNMNNADNEGNTDNMDNVDNEGNTDNMDNADNEGNTDNMDNIDNTDNVDRYNTETDNTYRDTNTFNNAGGLQSNINFPNIINDFLKSRGKDDSSSQDDNSSEYEKPQLEKKKVTIKKPTQERFHYIPVAKRAIINKKNNKNNTTTLKSTTTMKPTFITTGKPFEGSITTEEDVSPEDERSLALYLSQNKSTAIPLLTNVVEIHPLTFILDTKVETISLNLTSSQEAALHH